MDARQSRRVVITGMGALSPFGNGYEPMWNALLSGKSGISFITLFDTTKYTCKIAGQIHDFEPTDWMEKKEAKHSDRFCQFAIAASKLALEDSKLVIDDSNASRVGVLIGSGIGGLHIMEEQFQVLLEKGPDRVSPFTVPMMIADMGSGMVSIITGAKGPNTCVQTACATGTNAIGDAAEIIRRGDADAMITGGVEAPITRLSVAAFTSVRALSSRNTEPELASRPFDANRDGFIMSEGAGVVILEELEHAKKRGAHIFAEICGYGMSGDAYHMTQPHPDADGAIRVMDMAIKNAGIQPNQLDYINAHGTSTIYNDRLETQAIKKVLGEHAYKIPISSTKSMLGHQLGAAGAVEAIIVALAMRDSIIPPTMNYETPDPDCDLDYVPNKPRKANINYALSNSFGFGGHNMCLVLKKYEN